MINRLIGFAALFLVACSGTEHAPIVDAPMQDEQVWLDESSPLYAAQQAWGMALPWEPQVDLAFGTPEEVATVCGEGAGSIADACTVPTEHRIVFAFIPDEDFESLAEHELGHMLQKPTDQIHITDPAICPVDADGYHASTAIMCAYAKLTPGPTDADFEFVLGAGPIAPVAH